MDIVSNFYFAVKKAEKKPNLFQLQRPCEW